MYISAASCATLTRRGGLPLSLLRRERLTEYHYAYPVYTPIQPLKHEYQMLSVRSYLLFYWVNEEEKLVTVARVIYGKRDYKEILK